MSSAVVSQYALESIVGIGSSARAEIIASALPATAIARARRIRIASPSVLPLRGGGWLVSRSTTCSFGSALRGLNRVGGPRQVKHDLFAFRCGGGALRSRLRLLKTPGDLRQDPFD